MGYNIFNRLDLKMGRPIGPRPPPKSITDLFDQERTQAKSEAEKVFKHPMRDSTTTPKVKRRDTANEQV